MEKNINHTIGLFAYRDKKLDSFDLTIFTDNHTPEQVKVIASRKVMEITDEKVLNRIKDLEFYYLGDMDSVTGVITGLDKPELLFSVDSVILKNEK